MQVELLSFLRKNSSRGPNEGLRTLATSQPAVGRPTGPLPGGACVVGFVVLSPHLEPRYRSSGSAPPVARDAMSSPTSPREGVSGGGSRESKNINKLLLITCIDLYNNKIIGESPVRDYHGSDRGALKPGLGTQAGSVASVSFKLTRHLMDRRGELADRCQSGKQAPDWLPADPHGSAEGQPGTSELIGAPLAPARAACPLV